MAQDFNLNVSVSRRGFLAGASGLTFAAVVVALDPRGAVAAEAGGNEFAPNIWISIGTDNTVTIASPAAEMGQGSFTTLPAIIAEELDADWSHVNIVPSPIDPKFGHPLYKQAVITIASMTVRGYYMPLRLAGAQARRVLLDAAAEKWGVPASELTTEPSTVIHAPTNRRISYGEIAAFAKPPAQLPKIEEKDLKPASRFRLIGGAVDRTEVPLKTRGTAIYAMDVRVPGMIYAAVAQCPYDGGEPNTVDDTKARAIPGILDVVKFPGAVGVLGTTVEATQAAKNALAITWTDSPSARFDSEQVLEDFAVVSRDMSQRGVDWFNAGNVDTAMPGAHKIMRAEYRTRQLYHAQLEPLNATASVAPDGKSAEVWMGTQSPSGVVNELAKLLGTGPERITLHRQWLGGGYGRRSVADVGVQAVRLSKHAGKPVKVIWSREDDLRYGRFRPMTAHHIEAGLDADGKIIAWHHRIVAESVLESMYPGMLQHFDNKDYVLMKGSTLIFYDIPNRRAEWVRQIRGARTCTWRGVGVGHNLLPIEGFIDEIAHAQGKDPLAFRLDLTAKNPRQAHLLRTVAEMADWGRKREGTALGLALEEKDETAVAGIAEISLDRQSGKIKVHNVWAAVDCGVAVQPRNVAAQIEGGITYGLGQVLREEITIKDGHVQQSNYDNYQVIRMEDVPQIEVKVVSTPNPPTGIGEDGSPLTSACIANAFFALTGTRIRELPLNPARIKVALEGKT